MSSDRSPSRVAASSAAPPDLTASGRAAALAWGVVLAFSGLVITLILIDILRRPTHPLSWSQASGDATFASFAVALAGVAIFGYGVYTRRTQRLVENTPTSPVRSLPLGFVEVTGTAEPDGQPLSSPFAQTPCVYYEFHVQEYRGSGSSRRWVTLTEDRSTEPFYLRDATGRVLVVPMGASARIRRAETFSHTWPDDLPDEMRRVFRHLNMPTASWLGPRRVRFRERVIGVGECLYVLGTAQENPAGALHAADTSRLYIGAAPGDRPFMIVDEPERALLARLRWISFTCLYGGPLVSALALAWWLNRG
jgi:hypothetical protein